METKNEFEFLVAKDHIDHYKRQIIIAENNIKEEKKWVYAKHSILTVGIQYKIQFPNKQHPEIEIECVGYDMKISYNHIFELVYHVIELQRTKTGKLKKNLRLIEYPHSMIKKSELTIISNAFYKKDVEPGVVTSSFRSHIRQADMIRHNL